MTTEIIDIFGVKFIGPDMPVMTSEDGAVTIMKNDAGEFVSFSFVNVSFNNFLEFLSNFNIEILGLTNNSPTSLHYDFTKIFTASLERLYFQIENSDGVDFSENATNLKNLSELSIRNAFPLNMPSSHNFPNLIKLRIL